MNLQDILTDIDDRFPNALDQEKKIRWLNIVQKEIFREMAKIEIATFTTTKDITTGEIVELYELPFDVEFPLIESISVSLATADAKFEVANLNDDYNGGNIYFQPLEGYIQLHPIPSDGLPVYITYRKRPTDFSSTNLSETPNLRDDFLEVLKYGVFRLMAQAIQDTDLLNNYTGEYNNMIQQIRDSRIRVDRRNTIENVMGW